MQKRVDRRLAAILAADVVGYTRLIGNDEEGTVARLQSLRKELIYPSIRSARLRGRVIDRANASRQGRSLKAKSAEGYD